jgi:hypothetical protein
MILTWVCQFCGWANDNNNGPCRKCGGLVEAQLVNGHWRQVAVIPPRPRNPEPQEAAT